MTAVPEPTSGPSCYVVQAVIDEPSGAPHLPAPGRVVPWMWVVAAALVTAILVVVTAVVTRGGTASSGRELAAYQSTVTRDGEALRTAMTMDTDCSSLASPTCRASWVRFGAVVAAYQADLDRTPAPACAQTEDRELRASLASYRQADADFIAGLDARNAAAMDAALAGYGQGNAHMEASAHATQSANC